MAGSPHLFLIPLRILFLSIAFLLALPYPFIFSQTKSAERPAGKFSIELNLAGMSGWWLYNRGSTDPEIFNNRGFDRTRFAPFAAAEANFIYGFGRMDNGNETKAGVFLQLFSSCLIENSMLEMEHTSWDAEAYSIGKVVVPMYGFQAGLEYKIFNAKSCNFKMQASAGTFQIQTTHPKADSFGTRFCWQISLPLSFQSKRRVNFNFGPVYRSFLILPVASPFFHERHNFHFWGFRAGIQFLNKSKSPK